MTVAGIGGILTRAVKPEPRLLVILGVAVQQRVAALHGQQAGIKRGRNQVLSKLGQLTVDSLPVSHHLLPSGCAVWDRVSRRGR
jgi:hypothetical protein